MFCMRFQRNVSKPVGRIVAKLFCRSEESVESVTFFFLMVLVYNFRTRGYFLSLDLTL